MQRRSLQNEDKESTRQSAWGLLRSLRMTAGLGVSKKMSQATRSSTDGREGLLEVEGSVTQGWKLFVWLLWRKKTAWCAAIKSGHFSQYRRRGWGKRWFPGVWQQELRWESGWGYGSKIVGKDGWGQEGASAWCGAERHDGNK